MILQLEPSTPSQTSSTPPHPGLHLRSPQVVATSQYSDDALLAAPHTPALKHLATRDTLLHPDPLQRTTLHSLIRTLRLLESELHILAGAPSIAPAISLAELESLGNLPLSSRAGGVTPSRRRLARRVDAVGSEEEEHEGRWESKEEETTGDDTSSRTSSSSL